MAIDDDVNAIDNSVEVNVNNMKNNELADAQHYAAFIRLNIFQIIKIDTVNCTFLATFF